MYQSILISVLLMCSKEDISVLSKFTKNNETKIKELDNFRKDQIVVEDGWVSYPKNWNDKSKHDGILFSVPDNGEKHLVIYNVDDLLMDIPDFSLLDEPKNLNQENRYLFEVSDNKVLTKKEKKSIKAKELEALIREITKDESKVLSD